MNHHIFLPLTIHFISSKQFAIANTINKDFPYNNHEQDCFICLAIEDDQVGIRKV